MIDITHLLENVDCREVVASTIGQAKYHGTTAHSWPCPLHGETHGQSLTAWSNGWRCWGKCAKGGNAIDWLMAFQHVDFKEACRRLGAVNSPTVTRPSVRPVKPPKPVALPPAEQWQESAGAIVEMTEANLWAEQGEKPRAYLHNRGLGDDIIRAAHLGYLPGYFTEWITIGGISVPCGITIPWFVDDALWAIKVRRAAGVPKYEQIAGGNLCGALYWADQVVAGRPLLILEGEFDTLIAAQQVGDLVNPVTVGSASNNINPRWFGHMACSSDIYGCFDHDDAGKKPAERLAKQCERAKLIYVPIGKDLTDLHLQGEPGAVRAWIEEFVQTKPPLQEPECPPEVEAPIVAAGSPTILKLDAWQIADLIERGKKFTILGPSWH